MFGFSQPQPQPEKLEQLEKPTQVKCIQQPISEIDQLIHAVYKELAGRYNEFAAYVGLIY